jgi:hypothetical protein
MAGLHRQYSPEGSAPMSSQQFPVLLILFPAKANDFPLSGKMHYQ